MMGENHEEGATQDAEPTLFDSLKTRWYVAALGAAGLIACLILALSGVGSEWLDSIIGLLGGPQEAPATEESPAQFTEEALPPPADSPTATATSTVEESADETATSPAAEVGDGNCNAPCDPAAPNCLVGLACLPVSAGSANYVCWNAAICTQVTVTATVGVTPGITGTPVSGCGNGVCDPGEHVYNCPADCGAPPPPASCGDGACNGSESTANCPADCGTACGDGVCNGGEAPSNCTTDCGCGACGSAGCPGFLDCSPGNSCDPLCYREVTCYDYCGQCSFTVYCG